jgi:hypothetical protein
MADNVIKTPEGYIFTVTGANGGKGAKVVTEKDGQKTTQVFETSKAAEEYIFETSPGLKAAIEKAHEKLQGQPPEDKFVKQS